MYTTKLLSNALESASGSILTQGYIHSVNYTSPAEKKRAASVAQRKHLLSSFWQFENGIAIAI